MGWRFRRSVRVFPGLKLNFSKSGISTTIGTKGASVTVGPKGTYANVSIPGTGLYNRQKISDNNSKSNLIDSSQHAISSYESHNYECPLIASDIPGDKYGLNIMMPLFKSVFYVFFIVSMAMPIVGYLLSIEWDLLILSFLLPMLVQFVCMVIYSICAFKIEWLSWNLSYQAKKQLRSCWLRFVFVIVISLMNVVFSTIALFQISYNYPEFLGTFFLCAMWLIPGFWIMHSVDTDLQLIRDWKTLIIPSRYKSDKGRSYDIELVFDNIKIGDNVNKYISEGWVKKDEFDKYQIFSVQKTIVVENKVCQCDCLIYCYNSHISVLEIYSRVENMPGLFSLYETKYGSPKRGKVKNFNNPFTRTWNYNNQRIVFQYRKFLMLNENSTSKCNQVKISYIDNELYESMEKFGDVKYEKQRQEELSQTKKEQEEAKRLAEIEENNKMLQKQIECKQI